MEPDQTIRLRDTREGWPEQRRCGRRGRAFQLFDNLRRDVDLAVTHEPVKVRLEDLHQILALLTMRL